MIDFLNVLGKMISQIILDIKGVLYDETERGKQPRLGAVEFIEYLNKHSIPYILATNATSEMPGDMVVDLNNLGFEISLDKVTSCVELSASYLKSKGLDSILLISDNKRLQDFYSGSGLDVVDYKSNIGVDAVVAALDRNLEQRTLNRAIYEIENGAPLIALHRNMTRVDAKGREQPNVGQLVQGLEQVTGYQDTITIGKPSEKFYEEAMKKLPSQELSVTLAVGDDPVADLSGANKLGMHTAFVRSPKYQQWPKNVNFKPEFDVKYLMELVPYISC